MILPNDPLVIAILARAVKDIPIIENPIGSNRSPEIDAMCQRFGVPLGSAWCALWAASVWQDAGAEIPPTYGSSHPAKAESWRVWALRTNRLSPKPAIGAAVLYGNNAHEPAHHMGVCVLSVSPILLDLEGNTAMMKYSREGELTQIKAVDTDRLIGYVYPRPIQPGAAA